MGQPATAGRGISFSTAASFFPSLCAAAGLTFARARSLNSLPGKTHLLGRSIFLPGEWLESGHLSKVLLEVMQGQWKEYFLGEKWFLEMETLPSSGGRFTVTQLRVLALGGNVQCGAHPCVCQVGIPVVNSYLYWTPSASFAVCGLFSFFVAGPVCQVIIAMNNLVSSANWQHSPPFWDVRMSQNNLGSSSYCCGTSLVALLYCQKWPFVLLFVSSLLTR